MCNAFISVCVWWSAFSGAWGWFCFSVFAKSFIAIRCVSVLNSSVILLFLVMITSFLVMCLCVLFSFLYGMNSPFCMVICAVFWFV